MPDGIVSLIIVLVAIALMLFLIVKSKKTGKTFTSEATDDPVEEARTDQQRNSENE